MKKLLSLLFVLAILFVGWIVFSAAFEYVFGYRPIELFF